jgi:FkbM family methyltransferase
MIKIYKMLPSRLNRILKRLAEKAGLVLLSYQDWQALKESERKLSSSRFLPHVTAEVGARLFEEIEYDKSQFGQGILALALNRFKNGGFYVEMGATDGVELSNTVFLEKRFGWNGILAEPAICWHKKLRINRPNSSIDIRCVYGVSGMELEFRETGGLSTLKGYGNDSMAVMRRWAKSYVVKTININDLLTFHSAPPVIDFISIDTEGSEYSIIKQFDFNKWCVNFFSIEHNYGVNRDLVVQHMRQNGYVRVLKSISLCDDYFIPIQNIPLIKEVFTDFEVD